MTSETRFVFLICSERSGSNLIRAMLDAHPDIAAPQPLHFVRDVIARADALAYGDPDSPVAEAMMVALSRSLSKQFPEDTATEIARRAADAHPFTPREIMRAVYGGIAELTGAGMVVIKENELQDAAAQIIDTFPEARFVFQARDPRDYMASAVALKEGRLGNKFGSFRNALQIWANDQRFGLKMLGHFGPDRVFFQRYEDLVARSEPVLRDLCAFLGLPFSPAMLSFHETAHVQEFSMRKDAWRNLSRPVMAANFNKYRTELKPRQIKAIEAALGPVMDRLGYLRDFDTDGARWPVIWPSLLEPFERAANKSWTAFHTVANTKHHARLDRLAAPVQLPYMGSSASQVAPGHWPVDLPSRLLSAAAQNPDRVALRVEGEDWSYDRLFGAALGLATRLPEAQPVVGVFAARHASAYIGILAALLAGGTYVPLNCRFPAGRNREILQLSGAQVLVHGADLTDPASEILKGIDVPRLMIPEDAMRMRDSDWQPRSVDLHAPAYILFTSGSTGRPKGVPVSHRNLAAYVDAAAPHMDIRAEDRFSQTFDLTFDLSVHDMMLAWSHGATLCVPSRTDLAQPGAWARREKISQWFSVPSLAYTARQTGALKVGALPDIRTALFCGEALPSDLATEFASACPQARVENWYGPTEATIAILRHQIGAGAGEGVVPIGKPFNGAEALVVDETGCEVPEGETGTLFLGGPQVVAGYLKDPERSAKVFHGLPGRSGTYYDTGDLASYNGGILHFHGRRDFQRKIRGYRVELGEVETVLRAQAGGRQAVALAWPHGATSASHIVAAFEMPDPELNRAALAAALPDYMVPSSAFGFTEFPKNASGKVDRGAIAAEIAARIAAREMRCGDSLQDRLRAAILTLKPTLDPGDLERADSLLLAGLDSMDFVNLTLTLEEDFGLSLSEERVALMANLSLSELTDLLEKGQDASTALDALPVDRMVRANRALAFLEKGPVFLKSAKDPLVLAFGSSGTMRGIAGGALPDGSGLLVNIGLPALTQVGLARMALHLADLCRELNVCAVLHELDPMLLSTVPPKGDIALDETLYTGAGLVRRNETGGELGWDPERAGTLVLNEVALGKARSKARKPLWERERDHEIAAVYRGEIAFDAEAVAAWIAAEHALATLGAPVASWVHPLAEGPVGGGELDVLLAQLTQATQTRILGPEALRLPGDRFLNINHVTPDEGARALTDALIGKLAGVI